MHILTASSFSSNPQISVRPQTRFTWIWFPALYDMILYRIWTLYLHFSRTAAPPCLLAIYVDCILVMESKTKAQHSHYLKSLSSTSTSSNKSAVVTLIVLQISQFASILISLMLSPTLPDQSTSNCFPMNHQILSVKSVKYVKSTKHFAPIISSQRPQSLAMSAGVCQPRLLLPNWWHS